jgi:hypothetical protein
LCNGPWGDDVWTFAGEGNTSNQAQAWENLQSLACNQITQELLDTTNSITLMCSGQLTLITWTDSGFTNSFGAKIYDATVTPI